MVSVSGAILASEDINRPSKVEGIGFKHGTTGRLAELERYFELDANGIVTKVLSILRGNGL